MQRLLNSDFGKNLLFQKCRQDCQKWYIHFYALFHIFMVFQRSVEHDYLHKRVGAF